MKDWWKDCTLGKIGLGLALAPWADYFIYFLPASRVELDFWGAWRADNPRFHAVVPGCEYCRRVSRRFKGVVFGWAGNYASYTIIVYAQLVTIRFAGGQS